MENLCPYLGAHLPYPNLAVRRPVQGVKVFEPAGANPKTQENDCRRSFHRIVEAGSSIGSLFWAKSVESERVCMGNTWSLQKWEREGGLIGAMGTQIETLPGAAEGLQRACGA